MSICLFQGTFNPIHNAHIRVAKYVLDNAYVDKIIFIPAYNPPHKQTDMDIAPEHRFNMVKLSVSDISKFIVSDIEFKRQGISYTYLTVKELIQQYNINDRIKFIIGTDAFEKIESWYESDKLKDLLEFLVFSRSNNVNELMLSQLAEKGYKYKIMDLGFDDISSTNIRERIKNNLSIKHLVAPKVEEYIKRYELYRS
jgi:nicotinate-nucleotide adenylyltransferase